MAKRPTSRSKPSDPAAPAASAEAKPKRVRRAPIAQSSASADESSADDRRSAEPTADDIRRRAYERYLERGGDHGQHFDDWLEAEKELRKK